MTQARTPPYAIHTDRLLIRCPEPGDAPLLRDAVDVSLDALRQWMPWGHEEPRAVHETMQQLREVRGRFDLDQDHRYAIFDSGGSVLLGNTGLHARVGPRALEIGYWIRSDRAREGLATEAAAALTRVAFDICGIDRVEIHVEPANEASLGVPRKLGFVQEATLRSRLAVRAGEPPGDIVVFSMFADGYPDSPAASAPITAYDAAGMRIG
jgi:RimJ/RimL family protein N-acetyltransferase